MNLLSKNDSASLQDWLKELKEFQLDNMFDTNVLARAYLYTDAVRIVDNSENQISGTIGEGKYALEIVSQNNQIQGTCSCPFEGNCKHLAALLLVLISNE